MGWFDGGFRDSNSQIPDRWPASRVTKKPLGTLIYGCIH
jgi:hypothetical protein